MLLEYRIFRTRFGYVGIVGGRRDLRRVFLPAASARLLRADILREFPTAGENRRLLPRLCADLQRYFAGQPVRFRVALDWTHAPGFAHAVWQACRKIPYGQTASYQQLAERVGRPRAARAVGAAMGRNPWPIVVPCHRVVASGGGLGGYSGPGGVDFKRRLLELEARTGA